MPETKTRVFDDFLDDLAEELQIPPSRYEEAERRYKTVGTWLHRPGSVFEHANPQVYIQGSFRLGTAIRPVSEKEDYDVDLVCEVAYTKDQITQENLKSLLGTEMAGYAKAHGMQPPDPGRRCWTLNYAEGAQFHLDALPAIPDGAGRRALLESRGIVNQWAGSAVAITDDEHPEFEVFTTAWPHSNPKGYAEWFRTRMQFAFEKRRRKVALMEAVANVEDVPEYKVRTPLQSAIQILKRHRDLAFTEKPDEKPISIIITTLAARSYQQEDSIAAALRSILAGMDEHIETRLGVSWIPNPTDPLENFADKWFDHPERKQAFYDWLGKARLDFAAVEQMGDVSVITKTLEPRLGRRLVEAAAARRVLAQPQSTATPARPTGLMRTVSTMSAKLLAIISAPHRLSPPWSMQQDGSVTIRSVTVSRDGWRPKDILNDGDTVPKNASLTFHAETDIPKPYRVYWQIVNTGYEAEQARGLRGGFEGGVLVERGNLTRSETTRYRGVHSIECFIVKNGACIASSGPFLVNID